ncbi:MAG TPA: response regulator [Clostridia bacterium]|nr:response regulator [Clostridia bacterium]
MYRLLIVDDEEIIVNGLYEIFNSLKHLDLDVYKAYSGEEAMDWLNRTRIDIVLTDIRMPEIDGLQLMEKIFASWPQCKVIFLTGYNEFEYVYKAIKHNGVSYILKTEDNDKVIEAVENAIKEIQKGIKTENLIHEAKEQMNMALELFQKDYFLHLLHEDSALKVDKSQFEKLSVPMSPELPVILLLGQIDSMPQQSSYWDKIQSLYSVKLLVDQYLNTNVRNVNVTDEDYRFVIFIQPKLQLTTGQVDTAVRFDKASSFLKGTLEMIQNVCRESIGLSISFALSGEPCGWDEVSRKYYSLSELLNYRVGSGIEMFLIDNEFKNNILNNDPVVELPEHEDDPEGLELRLRQKNLEVIESYLESGQSEKYFLALSELTEPLKSIRCMNNNLALEAYFKVSMVLLSCINRWKLSRKADFRISLSKLRNVDKYDTWEEAVKYLYELSEIIFKLRSEDQKRRTDNAIEYIQNFVETHLNEDLSLVRLAEQVYLNPSYLSRFYKQAMGINLSEFIDNARIKKAKEMLEKDNIKINEVAKMVGYETAASFTRFFKKATGSSPQEYHDAIAKR